MSVFRGVKDFSARIGVHQCSDLSTYLSSLIIDEKTKNIQGGSYGWCVILQMM